MRVKGGFKTRRRHKRVLKLAEGMRGRRSKNFKHAKLGVQKALQYAYRDRRTKKREFRSLWIIRVNAAARLSGLSYSKFILGCKKAGITLDRKVLAELAMHNPEAFGAVAEQAKSALAIAA